MESEAHQVGGVMDEGFARNVAVETACFGRADAVTTPVVTGWFIAPSKGATADQITAFIDGEPAGHALVAADRLGRQPTRIVFPILSPGTIKTDGLA
jgi:hypothetical protein